jgi:hypothetical protein
MEKCSIHMSRRVNKSLTMEITSDQDVKVLWIGRMCPSIAVLHLSPSSQVWWLRLAQWCQWLEGMPDEGDTLKVEMEVFDIWGSGKWKSLKGHPSFKFGQFIFRGIRNKYIVNKGEKINRVGVNTLKMRIIPVRIWIITIRIMLIFYLIDLP